MITIFFVCVHDHICLLFVFVFHQSMMYFFLYVFIATYECWWLNEKLWNSTKYLALEFPHISLLSGWIWLKSICFSLSSTLSYISLFKRFIASVSPRQQHHTRHCHLQWWASLVIGRSCSSGALINLEESIWLQHVIEGSTINSIAFLIIFSIIFFDNVATLEEEKGILWKWLSDKFGTINMDRWYRVPPSTLFPFFIIFFIPSLSTDIVWTLEEEQGIP